MNKYFVPPGHNNSDFVLLISKAIKLKMGVDFTPELIEGFQRFPGAGKAASNQSCWAYISSDFTHASFGSHITGEKHTCHANDFEELSTEDIAEVNHKNAVRKQEALNNRQLTQLKAAENAKIIINSANKANHDNTYIIRKNIKPEGLYQQGGTLIVPLHDSASQICNVQRIYPDGTKRFLKGGRVKGSYGFLGTPFSTNTLYITEGFATAATLHEDTGDPVIAAMNAGNLLDVCISFASKAPSSVVIVVAADNDHRTKGNPGVTKGTAAAKAIGGYITYPPLPCSFNDCRCTDFNDWNNCSDRVLEVNND